MIQCRQILSTERKERNNGMNKYIKELVAKPRKTASGGKFQADLTPADILNEAAIAERWAASAAISVTMAKTMLASLEGFVMESLGEGLQLNFNLVSFYPRLSGALSAQNANPEADALYVRGAVKARRTLMEGIKAKLKAVNKASSDGSAIFNVLDKDVNKFDVLASGHVLSAIGRGIVFDPSRGDEGVWLERRVKKHGPVQVAKARLLTVESDHLEFMFDDPIPKGTYFLAVYTRHGKDTGYAPTRICRQIKTLPCARH